MASPRSPGWSAGGGVGGCWGRSPGSCRLLPLFTTFTFLSLPSFLLATTRLGGTWPVLRVQALLSLSLSVEECAALTWQQG